MNDTSGATESHRRRRRRMRLRLDQLARGCWIRQSFGWEAGDLKGDRSGGCAWEGPRAWRWPSTPTPASPSRSPASPQKNGGSPRPSDKGSAALRIAVHPRIAPQVPRIPHRSSTNPDDEGPDESPDQGSFFQRAAIFLASSPGTQMTTTFAPAGPVLWRIVSGGRTYPAMPAVKIWLFPFTTCSSSPEST